MSTEQDEQNDPARIDSTRATRRPDATAGNNDATTSGGFPARGAVLSADGLYRYRLWRIWDDLRPLMVWVMLNPSTADADVDDPTIRKCMSFAKAHRHGGIIVVNLFAWRATDPKALPTVTDPIGPENDEHIHWAVKAPLMATVVAAWGANKFAAKRAARVKTMIRGYGRPLHCFRQTATPWHPLYLPLSSPLEALR